MATFSQKIDEEMSEAFEENGLDGCHKLIEERLNEWQNMPMNIAVTGFTGTGKSSLINVFLDLNADEEGAAKVGNNETTETIQQYKHPKNEQLLFMDLPGVGTTRFPQQSYLRDIEVEKYDFFILVTSNRFTEIDVWLATELTKRKKGFFFVRTHIYQDVSNDKRAHPRSYSGNENADKLAEDKLVADIRRKTEAELKQVHAKNKDPSSPQDMKVKVFLVDNYEPEKYDFPDLHKELIANFPELKQEALLFTIRTKSRDILEMKAERLRSRIWKAAALSAGVAVAPIPGVSFVFDVSILLHETKFYYQQLGLDSQSLKRLAQTTGVDIMELEMVVRVAFGVEVLKLDTRNLLAFCSAIGISAAAFQAESAAEAAAVLLIPVIGQAVAASMSGLTTYWMLRKILDNMHDVAKELNDVIVRRVAA